MWPVGGRTLKNQTQLSMMNWQAVEYLIAVKGAFTYPTRPPLFYNSTHSSTNQSSFINVLWKLFQHGLFLKEALSWL